MLATDTIRVKQTKIPILIEREDNVLFYFRIDASESEMLNELVFKISDDTNLDEIEAIKLYYSGTESVQRENEIYFAPVEYITSHAGGNTLKANSSYSIKVVEQRKPSTEVTLSPNYKLFPGINYFWVSLQMKPSTSTLSKVDIELLSAKLDYKDAPLLFNTERAPHRMGVGVRHAGDDGSAAFRIPGLATSNDGSLLAVYDVRYNNSVDLQEYVDVGLSRSTDKGKTWDKMVIPMSFGEYDGLPKAQNGVGDPAILVDTKTGAICIVAAWTHGMGNHRAWHNSQDGMTKERTAQLILSKSIDDGKTWSDPINITEQVKEPSWKFLLQGPGRGITMQDGTLVFPIQYIDSTRVPNAGIMYSKDRGETWLEHPSSRSVLQEPVCMASLIKVEAKDNVYGKDILLFSNPNTTKGRHHITIKASLDGGLSFPTEYDVLLDEAYGWGYSCLTLIDAETVGILYESSVAHMTFQAVPLKDILK